MRELEQALGRCSERFRDLLAEILRDLRWEITTCELHLGTVPTPAYSTTPSPGEDPLGSLGTSYIGYPSKKLGKLT
jgi:hypothetical protein